MANRVYVDMTRHCTRLRLDAVGIDLGADLRAKRSLALARTLTTGVTR
ncbi:hypothetical protein AB0L62_33100 [Nocardia asteroides]